MGKMIQCDACLKIINPGVGSYAMIESRKLYFCPDCGDGICDAIGDYINAKRKGARCYD